MPFIDDTDLDLEYGGAFQSFAGGSIGDLTIAPVDTKTIDDSQVQALENSAAQLSSMQSAREAEEAAAAAAAAKLAEEQRRSDSKAAIIADINTELGALSSLMTRLNAIITLATPYTNSKYSDVSSAATTIVNGANALKASISNLVTSLNTAKATASNASVSVL